ncbi:site-specific integrase [Vibrio sp. S9_S30]|uniref:tyrosine-type recombinase/integrase n=1 Tax=Vibrio sp. S9_S30 TaxID=2720226 RepID=UPI001681AD28|nr:tyrosine-type recombinase/integrase [Vibrio sp. S9_S30]MBD1559622.1 site-specific integrase [Vibrio sp. S9_S30]
MTEMIKVVECDLTESAIERYQKIEHITELNFHNLPLRLRFLSDRSKASWFLTVRESGRARWRKVGAWPLIPAKTMKKTLPEIAARYSCGEDLKSITADHFTTVGQMLDWYRQRNETDNLISQERKVQIRSVIKRHLLPVLGGKELRQLNKVTIESEFLWKLQANGFSLATLKSYFSILSLICDKAAELDLINVNPLATIRFKALIKKKIPHKDGKLKAGHIPEILDAIGGEHDITKALVYMMLSHGTRQGETRKARWSHIDLSNMTWYLPSQEIKTKEHEHTLPITNEVFEYLKLHRNFLKEQGYVGDYIFPSKFNSSNSPPIGKSKACALIRTFSQRKWTSHDLRKLCSSTWTEEGEDYLVIKFLLNHHIPKLDKTYIQAYIEPRKRETLERWQAHLKQEKSKTIARW